MEERDRRALLGELRERQRTFERVRRNHLPWAWSAGGGSCDERIGRFCITHGSGSDWEPEPEHERIAAARNALLEALAAGARRMPEAGWIAGQRVRYLIEASRYREAAIAAAECEADVWWCTALLGFALHYGGHPASADSAFTRSLAAMPESERGRWSDLSPLLDDCALRTYRRLSGDERRAYEARFWRLADPFRTRPGNEVRSEHFARNVWAALQDRAASAEGLSWGKDLREILIRYGWPQGWERVRPRSWSFGPEATVSHYAGSDRDLLPPCEIQRDGDLIAGEWDQEPPQPRTGYALPMPDSAIEWLSGVGYQVAVFRSGDSAVVVAGYEILRDSLRADAVVEAAVELVTPDLERAAMAAFPRSGHSDVVSLGAPRGPLLLLARPDPLPQTLRDAAPLARRTTRVAPGERVGVYWEMYGLSRAADDEVFLALRLVERDEGWLRGLGRRLGLTRPDDPVLVRWRETPRPADVISRALAITIPEATRAGSYALELSVTGPGREPLAIRRNVTVEPVPPPRP